MPDDIGYGDFACLGNPIIRTPHIDRLHGQSVCFTNFHVSPTCAPTRSALMTGRHEFRNGVTHTIQERERMRLDATTIAQVLKSAGYSTGIFGKWHLGDEDAYQPEKRGFDETFIHGAGGIGQTYPGSCGDAPGNTYFNPAILHNGKFVKTQGFCTDIFFSRAIEWMDECVDTHKPYFALITPNAAHAPLSCPPDYERLYAGKVPANVATFFGMITNIDDNVGRLLGKLDEWGHESDTLVIFMTDNGGTAGVKTFNAGMRGAKGTPYEGGTRVPSFWRWPNGWKGGVDVPALTAHLDIFSTLAEIAGAKVPEPVAAKLDGRSLLPLLKNPALFFHGANLLGTHELPKAHYSELSRAAFDAYETPIPEVGPPARPEGRSDAMIPFGIDPRATTIFAFNPAVVSPDGEMEVIVWVNELGERYENFAEFLGAVSEMLEAELAERSAALRKSA